MLVGLVVLATAVGIGCSDGGDRPDSQDHGVVFDLVDGFSQASFSHGSAARERGSKPYVNPDRRALFIPYGDDVVFDLEVPAGCVLVSRDARMLGSAVGNLEIVWAPAGGGERILTRDLTAAPGRLAPFDNGTRESGRLILKARAANHADNPQAGVRIIEPQVLAGRAHAKSMPNAVPGTKNRRLNIVVYLIDALRADRLGCCGYDRPTSPNIDEFSATAVRFNRAQAQTSWTRPAVASIFTGLLPQQHTAVDKSDSLPASAVTIAELLGGSGYETAAVIANGNVSQVYGFSQGFSYFKYLEEVEIGSHVVRSDEVNEAVFSWLDDVRGADPFFLYIHTVDPHLPYDPPSPFREAFAPGIEDPSVGTVEMVNHLAAHVSEVTPELVAQLSDLYDGEVAANDAAFGRLVAGLRDRGLWDDTVVVLVSDHGEEFFEHRGWTHGNTLFAEMLDVPLMMKIPGVAAQDVAEIVQHVDVFPTLLELAGVGPPTGIFGRSSRPLWAGGNGIEWVNRGLSHLDIKGRFGLSWVDPQWKLLIRRSPDGKLRASLFDRHSDPEELHDLASDHPEIVEELWRLYDEAVEHAGESLPGIEANIDRETEIEAQLKALGYL